MESCRNGKIVNQAYVGFNKVVCTLMIDQPFDEKYVDQDIRIKVSKKSERRGLKANAYLHKLLSMMAEAQRISLTEVKNYILAEYGQFETDGEELVAIGMADSINWMKLEYIHLRPTTESFDADGKRMRKYHVIRGSHTYDTREFSRLLDGCIEEAQACGIETLPPDEIERMKNQYEVDYRRKNG